MPTLVAPSSRRATLAWRLIVGGLVVAVAAAVIWRVDAERSRPPHVLDPVVGGFGFEVGPVPVAESTTQVGFMSPYVGKEDPETLTFRSATAHFRNNSADATATISVCLPRSSPNGGLGGGGVVRAPTLAEYCREARPVVSGTTLRWGTESVDGEFLVLTMKPTQPGTAEVDSITFDYKRDAANGGHSGVEHVDGLSYVVRAS